jgi:SNF2 family DNA or RNA helicase
MAEELLQQGRQVVLFTEFADSAKILADHFRITALTGETSAKQRTDMVDDFQAGKTHVFVGTVRAGGIGITLTSSQDEILVDRPWTPGATQQVEDRLHRIGQKNKVNIWWLRFGAVDDKIDNTLEAKMKNINHMLTGNPDASTFYEGLAADIFGNG